MAVADRTMANWVALRAALAANIPTILWGDPGIGKSAAVKYLCRYDARDMVTVFASLREATDFDGLPYVDGGQLRRSPDDWVQDLLAADNPLLFLDEASNLPPSVQVALLAVLWERQSGRVDLPAETRIVLAANPLESATDGFMLSAANTNRLLHLQWELDVDRYHRGWLAGYETVVPSDAECRIVTDPDVDRRIAKILSVQAFHHVRPDMVQQLPTDPDAAGQPWPSARSWQVLADLLTYIPDDATDAIAVAAKGLVGAAAGKEFVTFLRHFDLPSPASVLDDVSLANFTDRPDRVHALLTGVTYYTLNRGTKRLWTQAMRLMGMAAEAGRADAAAASVVALYRGRPDGVVPSAKALAPFVDTLTAAGLLDTSGQAA